MPDIVYSVGTTSSSCTFGNLIEYVHQDVLSKFPYKFFRDEFISTTLAFRQMKRYMDNSEVEIRKKEKPLLIIRPTFEVGDDSIAFRNTPLTWNVQSNPTGMSRKSILPFIKDHRNAYCLGYRLNRDKMNFDVTIQMETLTNQLDTFKALENAVGFGNPFTKRASLESVIPFQIVEYISKIIHCPIDPNKPETIPPVLQYLQNYASYPITYKIRNSTSQPEFYMYYEVPVIITYSDLSIDDGNRKGMTDDIYSISFRVSVEFNHPGAFIMIGSDIPKFRQLRMQLHVGGDNTDVFIPIYTMDRLFEDKHHVFDGYKLYTSTLVKTEEENYLKDDIVDLSQVIEIDYIPILRKYNFSDIPSDILFRFKVYCGRDTEMVEGKDYDIDWYRLELIIHNSDPKETYRILVYQNKIRCNEELVLLAESKMSDKTYDALYNQKDMSDFTPEINMHEMNYIPPSD